MKKTINEIIEIRKKYQLKQFNRYKRECVECGKGRLTNKKKSQLVYSTNKMYEALAIYDELNLIIDESVLK